MLKETSYGRLLSICDIFPSRFGSFEEFLVDLTEKLTEADFEHIIVFRKKPIKDVEEALLNLGAKIIIIKPSRYHIHNFVTFYKIIKKVRPNIVHFHFFPSYTVLNCLKLIFDIKIVYTDHMGGRNTKNRFKKLLRTIYYYSNSKLFGFGVDKIVCVSNFVKSKYSKEYNIHSNKLCVIYNGINLNRFKKNIDVKKIKDKYNIKDEFVITCVGLREDKGAHLLVKAAPLILQKIPDTKFILVGSGNCKSYIKKLIEKLNVASHVLLLESVPDITDIYNISSCVVIPSLFEEAFCFVAAEAMATETPIIAFDSGAIKEVSNEPSLIIPKKYDILAQKTINFLKNDTICHSDARKHVVENFSIHECTRKYLLLYGELLGNTELDISMT